MNSLDLFAILEMAKAKKMNSDQIADLIKAADAPVADAPVADAPVADAPVADAPVADAPVADAPVADAPVADAPVADAPVAIDSLVLSKSEKFSNALNAKIEYIKVDAYNIRSFAGLHGVTITDLGDLGYKRSVTEVLEKYSIPQYAARWVNEKGATRHYCYIIEQIKAMRSKDAAFKSEMDAHIRIQKTAKPKAQLQDLQITW